VIAAIGALAVVAWVFVTNAGPILAGHPSYLVLYGWVAAVGIGTIAFAWWKREADSKLWREIVWAIVVVGVAIVGFWLNPFGATELGLSAMDGLETVTVTQSSNRIVLEPTSGDPTVGLVFYPGARVDARAYARILTPIAEAGARVVIVKEPLGIAFFATSAASSIIEDEPDIERWIVGGHSLGGVVAAAAADDGPPIEGLLLYASYPASDISGASVDVSSIYGTDDAIAPPSKVEASASDLPSDATFVPVDGGIHSFFGNYGFQRGDGDPGVSREEAQTEIVAASLALLERLG
jgi:dienelactone hydrolase